MTHHTSNRRRQRRQCWLLNLYHRPILLIVTSSVLPTIVLLTISYFQEIAYTRASLENTIKVAATETTQLLEDADTILHRSNIDLQNADSQTAVNILKRQIYNDFRFREAGIVNPEGLLTLSSLGVVDPPVPVSPTMSQFNADDPDLQILGPGRSRLMQEKSIVLIQRGSGNIHAVYLLVDPKILIYFLRTIPNQDLGTDGFIAFMTRNQHLLSSVGASPQDIFSGLNNPSGTIQATRTTEDGNITIVGQVSRKWALRHWLQKFLVAAPLTVLMSSFLSYLFVRQIQQANTLDYELRRGLEQNEFEVHYQPIVDLATRQCVGAEALLRWRHPQRGLIYPGLFIPIAEQTGFIIPMTEWLLEKVIQDQASLEDRFPNLYTSVNLSPTQLNTGNVDRLIQTLRAANAPAKTLITFEITENKLVEGQEQLVQDVIARFKLLGIRFAIDDFGTGYSNISYLQRLDIDQLKLDQFFVKGLEQGDRMAQIVDSLIDLGNRIGLTVVAEGIETEVQYRYLRDRGIRYGQGWLFSRPLTFEDFERFLNSNNPDEPLPES